MENATTPLILVAEDDEISYLYLSNILIKLSCNVIRAKNGKDAVDLCRNNPEIRIALMDINMPVMDGFEATGVIKSFRPDLTIVAVTAYTYDNTRQDAMDAGCDDYLAKPVTRDMVIETLVKFDLLP